MTTRRSKGGPDSSHAGPAEEGMNPQPGGAEGAYAYGIAVRQMDAMDRLLRMLAAHGDLLATTQATDLAEGALPAIGEALHTDALAMRDILDQVETQRLDEAPDRQDRVEERHAVYTVTSLRMAALH